MKLPKILVVFVSMLAVVPAFAQDNMQILRDKIKTDKKLVVAANMQLTDAEAKGFWPVYDAYQKDLEKINGRLTKLILNYANVYNQGPVPDATAKKLLDEALAIEEAELKLKRNYIPKLKNALPDWKVARYVQIENKIRAIIRYQLAAGVPLVE